MKKGAGARICVAEIAAAHGVRGLVKLRSFTEAPENLLAYGPLLDERDRPLRLELRGPVKGGLLAAVEGVDDRTAAERLKGLRLYVPRERLPQTADEDEFYQADLIGLRVELEDGTVLGTVRAVENYGAGDLLDLQPVPGRRPVLLPFTKEAVPIVDLSGGRLVARPPEGLLQAPAARSGA